MDTVSTITKGKHMNPILNALGIKASVFGNHDFGKDVEIRFMNRIICCMRL